MSGCWRERKKWNEHIDRMTEERIVKITRDKLPAGHRSIGRPTKRWRDNLPKDYSEARM